MRPRPKALFILIVVAIIWGLASVVIKATLSGIEPASFLLYRFAISSLLAVFSYKKIQAITHKTKRTKSWILLYSILSTPVALGVLFAGLAQSTVLTLAIFTALEPIILAVASHFFFKEHLTHLQKIGAALAVVGSLISISPEFFASTTVNGTLIGSLLIFLYILIDASSILILKKVLRLGVDGTVLTHISFIVGFLFLIPAVWIVNPHFFTTITLLPASIHLGVLYMAVLSGTIAFSLRAKAQKTIGISEAGFMGYLVPILSTLFALIFLSEQMTITFAIGAAFIAIGVYLIEFKKHK
jgi:drug/metabolite transporter (DMT)-like permease